MSKLWEIKPPSAQKELTSVQPSKMVGIAKELGLVTSGLAGLSALPCNMVHVWNKMSNKIKQHRRAAGAKACITHDVQHHESTCQTKEVKPNAIHKSKGPAWQAQGCLTVCLANLLLTNATPCETLLSYSVKKETWSTL